MYRYRPCLQRVLYQALLWLFLSWVRCCLSRANADTRASHVSNPSGKALREAFWGIMTPVVILGGIYGGVFTPTEAAAVAIFYGLFVEIIFIYRTINRLEIITEILTETAKATAIVMIVVTCAGLYSWVGSAAGLVEKCSGVLLGMSNTPWIVLLMINIILLFAGMLLDAISIYYVFLPFMLPIVSHFQWDPVWFGIMMTINLAVGQVTPPVAVNLMLAPRSAASPWSRSARRHCRLLGQPCCSGRHNGLPLHNNLCSKISWPVLIDRRSPAATVAVGLRENNASVLQYSIRSCSSK